MNRLTAVLAFLASTASVLPAQRGTPLSIEHRIVVPDTLARISPTLPLSSEYIPGADYDQMWHEIAACEGLWLPVDYLRVRFFQVNAPHFYDQDHPSLFWKDSVLMVRWAIAESYPSELLIFVALPFRSDRWTIEHEMLHFLIYWNHIPPGKDLHPMPYYMRCGMTVSYEGKKS